VTRNLSRYTVEKTTTLISRYRRRHEREASFLDAGQ